MVKFLKILYNCMKYRVTNPKNEKHIRLYKDLEIMEKEQFLKYINDKTFNELWISWNNSGKIRKLTPTPDRINSTLGYTVDNIKWRTLSENSKRVRFNLRKQKLSNLPIGVRKSHAKHVIKFEARIRDNYKNIHLGTFNTVQEAKIVYNKYKDYLLNKKEKT